MKKSLKTVLSVVLTVAMLITVMVPAFAAGGKATDANVRFNFEKVENGPAAMRSGKAVDSATEQMQLKGNVRVSIVLDEAGTIASGYPTAGIAANKAAMSYRDSLRVKQNALAEQISREILGGKKLDVKWNITLAANIISATVPATAIARIEKLDGVKKVVVEQQYEPAVAQKGGDQPNMATSTYMTSAQGVWSNGYYGAGSKVAIIDTGIDTDHKSFDADAFDYAISKAEGEVDLLTAEEVADLYASLNIAQAVPADDAVYVSSKIPFAVNYVDEDLDVTHDNDTQGEHGSHVAGIATANRFIKEADGTYSNAIESVQTQGAAPDAQLIVMKVFGKGGGAYDSDYMVAIEDAVMLGADAVNLSLGSAAAGYVTTDDTYEEILKSLEDTDTVVTISAGNNGAWADQTQYGLLFGDDVNYDTVGSPGTFANAFTAASVDNDGSTGPYLVADGEILYYTETYDYANKPFVTVAGEHEFVYIDSPGREEEFAGVADILEGKIGICNRGSTSFFQKGNAAVESGAIATIIANNQAGTISMNLTGYEYPAPCVSITQADGAYLKSIATGTGSFECDYYDEDDGETYHETVTYYTGSLTVSSDAKINYVGDVDYHTMSSFSSFGVPGDLSLKPEITTPGGNIYSVNGLVPGGESYENMSGTSMAAPHRAGLTALLAQYIRENDLTEKTGLTARQLAQSLLMSTAEPMLDSEGYYYPVFQQGAGLADVDAAMNAKSYIMMDESFASASDGKVKAELGDDPDRIGEYDVTFTLNNFSDEDVEYLLDYDIFTQWFAYRGLVRDTSTDFIEGASVEWIVNGQALEALDLPNYDFNMDGDVNAADAVYLLEYLVDNVAAEDIDLTNADVDEDGDVDTYDAYEALKAINNVTVNAPAGGSVEITAHIDLGPYMPYYYDYNGNYVEAYLYVGEVDSDDGALGVIHSIPVLGFYGSWTEAGMTDKVDYLEYVDEYLTYGEEPYYYLTPEQGFLIRYAGESGAYIFGGNPVLDDIYQPERNAINGETGNAVLGVQNTLIRNIAGWRYTVTDKDGNDLIEPVYGGAKYGAYYYANQQKWMNTSTQVGAKYVPSGLAEGDTVTFTVTYAPEYYVKDDGSIDWDALGDGATKSITATVDNTAPKMIDAAVSGYDPATYDWTDLTVIAQDNQYIAAIVVFNEEGDVLGICYPDAEAEAGAEMTFTLNHEELQEEMELGPQTKLLVQVYDYAANVTNYKMNLDVEDLGSELTITLPEYLVLVRGNSQKLTPVIEPWGADESVIWISGDETVATVDANGVVTGVADGETYVAAISAVDNDVYAVCPVLVKSISKDLNGVIWDEHGEVWFSEFNTNELPAYTKLTEESANAAIASLAYGADGTLYAASFDSEEWLSNLYTVDPETFELTYIGGSDVAGYMDLCPSYALGADYMYAVYGPYIMVVETATGDLLGYLDYEEETGGNYFVGIAYEEFYPYTSSIFYDFLFLLDESGTLYEVGINNRFGSTAAYEIGNLGYETDTPYFNSLYFDGESLFWSRFSYDDSLVNIIDWDASDTGEVFDLGAFDPDVWPVGGLIELEPADPSDDGNAFRTEHNFTVKNEQLLTEIAPVEKQGVSAKGSLNEDDPTDPTDPTPLTVEDEFTQNVEIKAIDVATNGMVTVKYDASKFTFAGVKSAATHYAVNDDAENGEVTFAYINHEGKTFDKDAVVATLTFTSAETADGDYTVTTNEINNEHPEDASEDVSVSNEHVYGDPQWTWDDKADPVTASVTFKCIAHEDCDAEPITVEATVEITAESHVSCTTEECITYTATAVFEGETYTDTLTNLIERATGHDLSSVDRVEAKCEEDGNVAYYHCSLCGKNFVDEDGETEIEDVVIPATGHDWVDQEGAAPATCTEDGRDYRKCSNCDSIIDEVIPATGHDLTFVPATVTCTAAGKIAYYECGTCGKFFADENGETELTAAELEADRLGHDWDEGTVIKEPTCTEGGVMLYTCRNDEDHTKTEFIAALGHEISDELVPAKEATCTEDGNVAYYECTVCGAAFEDAYGYYEIADVVVPATGHKMTKTEAKAATCTEDGNVEYYTCGNCGKIFADEAGATELTETVIKAEGHKMTKTEAKAATCEKDGNVEFYTCSVCGNRYADEAGETALADEEIVIEALGHDWDEGTPVKPATCTERGMILFTCNNDMTHTYVVALDMLGHNFKFDSFVWAEDGATAKAKLICSNDASHIELVDAEMTSAVTDPTCVADGFTVYTASYNGNTADNTVTAEGTKLGHNFDETLEANVTVVAATCTEAGSKTVKCSRCDATDVTEIPALGHDMTKTEANPATCTEDGTVEYYTCGTCGKIFADANGETELEDIVDKAAGHSEEVIPAVPATCETAGSTEGKKCSKCGEILEAPETIPATGHTLEKVEAKDATATEPGNIEYYKCSECGKYYKDAEGKEELSADEIVIPALGIRLGDVDNDGDVDAADARAALRIAVGLDKYEPTDREYIAADVNCDGSVTADDARSILRVAVKVDKEEDWYKN